MCGEKSPSRVMMESGKGSPPRVRGKVQIGSSISSDTRITPACAGKSFSHKNFPLSLKDHPRVCGEKAAAAQLRLLGRGSPPRVRGKARCDIEGLEGRRITPACAGKRPTTTRTRRSWRDHPRVRGEKPMRSALSVKFLGSPPRARGKGRRRSARQRRAGITPACAGKRDGSRLSIFDGGDHPRVRGEKRLIICVFRSHVGSPPRARGKDERRHAVGLSGGITPACAGKSLSRNCTRVIIKDHPRVRGEKSLFHASP